MGLALVDVIPTLLLILMLAYVTKQNIWIVSLIVLLFVIFIHWLFCVETALNHFLGLV